MNNTLSQQYDEAYFERGIETGKSGYQNYSWMPELSMKMAHHLVTRLGIESNQRVLDFGCAKGFLVKALRLLDVHAYGVDVSSYAIQQVDPQVRSFCKLISDVSIDGAFDFSFDWLIAKDVFEHLTEQQLTRLLSEHSSSYSRVFAAVPLGKPDGSGFIIPDYDRDITHVTVKSIDWWIDLFKKNKWTVDSVENSFRGVKDNWVSTWPTGNAFFVLSR